MVALKRNAEGEGNEEEDKKRKVEALMKLTGEGTSTSTSSSAPSTSRQMQGQSAESGMHSIDSDEEEEYEKTKAPTKMADGDVEGVLAHQEERTIDRDGDIQITPFNLKDEEEEGSFDKDGTFMWKKKGEDEATDSWLEGVDWGKVRERSEAEEARRERDDEKEEEAEAKYDEVASYRAVLELLRPKESVAKAIQRLGGGKKTTAQKLKEKKRQREGKETEEEKANRENMTKLTGLADAILSRSGRTCPF